MMAHEQIFLQSPSGSIYPRGYVVAVFDDRTAADAAIQALQAAGYASDRVRLFESEELVARSHEQHHKRNALQRLIASFQLGSDDGLDLRAYYTAAQRGGLILYVNAHNVEIDEVHMLLSAHQAHTIKYFGRWTITNLPPIQPPTLPPS